MRVLDLCTEFGSETAAFRDRGHEVVTLGIEGNVDIKCDIRKYYPSVDDKYDFIIAHPPCTEFSLADWRKGKCKDRKPDLSIVWACQRIINTLEPRYWIIENPRGCLRHFIGKPQATIMYHDYGFETIKPTDLWGDFPFFYSESKRKKPIPWEQHTKDKNGNWLSFKESAKLRALVPYGLSLAICKAIERDLHDDHIY